MQAKVTWFGKRKFTAVAESGRTVVLDAKPEAGGEGDGVRPMELLLMGLGGCTGIDMAMILERMRIPLERLEMRVDGERAADYPQKYTGFTITYEIDAPGASPDKVLRAIALSQDKYCSVAHSLTGSVQAALILNGERVNP